MLESPDPVVARLQAVGIGVRAPVPPVHLQDELGGAVDGEIHGVADPKSVKKT